MQERYSDGPCWTARFVLVYELLICSYLEVISPIFSLIGRGTHEGLVISCLLGACLHAAVNQMNP